MLYLFRSPKESERKFVLTMWGLISGTAISIVGILKGSDLLGLAGLVTAVGSPILWAVLGYNGEWKAKSGLIEVERKKEGKSNE